MFNLVDTRVPGAVEQEVASIYLRLFPGGEKSFVLRAFEWARQCFAGQYADYQAIDARYHDLEHTLQGTLCLARLLQGRQRAGAKPPVSQELFELGLLAILFHDTGYLKKRTDAEGTGAKYTATHVNRSMEFAREFLAGKQYGPGAILAVQNMIRCTGLHADLQAIPFQSELEKMVGLALATADLLGQMAAPDYVDKLEVLYQEFSEAAHYDSIRAARFAVYHSAEDLMRRTPEFWASYVLPRINGEFGRLYTFLNDPYPDGPNIYLEKIEENMGRLRRKLEHLQH